MGDRRNALATRWPFVVVVLAAALLCGGIGADKQQERNTGVFGSYEDIDGKILVTGMPTAWPWFVLAGVLTVVAAALAWRWARTP